MSQQDTVQARAKWRDIEALSRDIYHLATQTQWQAAVDLYVQRRKLLEDFFSGGIENLNSEWLQNGIKQLQQCDAALRNLAENSRDSMAASFHDLSRTGQALNTYKNTASG